MDQQAIELILDGQPMIKAIMDHCKPVKLKGGKSNPLQGRVTQYTTGSEVTLCSKFTTYHELMQEACTKAGTGKVEFGERRWGQHIGDTLFIEHLDNLYVQLIIDKVGTRRYLVDDKEATAEEVAAIEASLPNTYESSTQLPLRLAAMNIESIITIAAV